MKCQHCGGEVEQSSKFCPKCGQVNTTQVKGKSSGLKFISYIAAILALALVITFVFGKPFNNLGTQTATNFSGNEKSFDSPEDAIEYCVEAIADNKLSVALSAFAIDDYTREFDFTKWCNRMKALILRDLAPSEYKMYQDINHAYITSKIVSQVKGFSYSLLSSMDLSQTIVVEDEEQVPQFVEDVDPKKLKGLKIVRIDPPCPDILNSERNVENFKIQAAIYGGEEGTERVVLYELDGELYAGGFHLIQYKDGWHIESMTSYLAGTSVDGSVTKMTKDDYLEWIE